MRGEGDARCPSLLSDSTWGEVIRGPLAQLWEAYRASAIPGQAPSVQVQETRRAYYHGIGDLLELLLQGLHPTADVYEEDEELMEEIQSELYDFFKEVQAGRA